MKRFWNDYLKRHSINLLMSLLCMMIGGGAIAGVVRLIQPVIDQAFHQSNRELLYVLAWVLFGLFVVRGFSGFLQSMFMNRVILDIINCLQEQMFQKLMFVELSYFQKYGADGQISRFSIDVGYLREGISTTVLAVGRDIPTVLFLVVVMFTLNWKMSLFSILFLGGGVFFVSCLSKRLRTIARLSQEESALLMARLADTFRGIRQIKAYQAEDYEIKQVFKLFQRIWSLSKKSVLVHDLRLPIMDTVGGLMILLSMLWGGRQIFSGHMTTGSFMAFFFAAFSVYQPARRLTQINRPFQEAISALNRIFSLIDYHGHIVDKSNAKEFIFRKGRIVFENVSFRYQNAWVLKNVSFVIEPGHTVAFVGPSGAGKSTIINLIAHFYDLEKGIIWVDDQNVAIVKQASYRKHIALVSQETGLFNGSIYENIAYGVVNASLSDVISSAQHAGIHDVIMQFPEQYHTLVGEGGVRLSGGQRQRVMIARAFFKNAPILLLDEPTSALDITAERKIQYALHQLTKGRTTIVVAHRLSTIQQADRIFVLDHGHLLASGTHQELLKNCALYASMALGQTEGIL